MKISHQNPHCILKEYYYPDLSSRNCLHIILLLSWVTMLFVGATIVGVGTNNISITFPYCLDNFCTYSFVSNSSTTLYFYVKIIDYHQNNRMFLDFYSIKQLHGNIDNINHCSRYYTYGALNQSLTVGGYRVNSSANAHPCGEAMTMYSADTVYLVNSQGGTPTLDNGDLISSFSSKYHFKRLNQYQLSQWVDVQAQQFVNYFTIPATSVKYQLIGKASVTAGNYQIVIQNNYGSQGQLKKELLVTETGLLGITNQVLGFTMFAYGLLLLFIHVYVCFHWRK